MTTSLKNPVPWVTLRADSTNEQIDQHRLDLCPYEDDCLSIAANDGWEGFTCSFCKIYLDERLRAKLGKPSLIPLFKRRGKETQ